MSTRRRVTNAEVGVAIVMALLALSLLAVVGLGLATMGSGNLRNVVMLNQGNQASFAAEGAAWLRAAATTPQTCPRSTVVPPL